jgi:hypothetical protein
VNSGVATAVAPGSADVSAKVDVMSAKQTMTVDVGCAFTLSPASVVLAAEGGTQVVNVSAAPAGCAPSTWTAASNDAGLTVSPNQGSGSAAVTVTVAANGTRSQVRTATIAGQTFTANVAAACTVGFTATGSDATGPAAGQRDVSVVVTNGPCRWTAASSDSWISVSQTEGTTSTTVKVSYAPNTGGDRIGSVTFSGPDCNPQCRTSSMNVVVRQARATSTLSLTLEQGENLSGPYAGYATGPSGFQCALGQRDQRIVCPPLEVPTGTSVTIVITLTVATFDRPIFRTAGCDSRTTNSCAVQMNADRSVTIGVGCGTSCSPEPASVDAIELGHLVARGRAPLPDADDWLCAEEGERQATAVGWRWWPIQETPFVRATSETQVLAAQPTRRAWPRVNTVG